MEKLTDKYLWKSLKEGDLNAFAVLFETYYPLLHSYGLKISKNEALTEDSLQDFFLYIYEKRENLSDLETIAPYLFTSYKRFIIKVIQKNKKMKTTDFSEEIITDIQFTKEELITNQETKSFKNKNIEILLNKLPKRQKEAIYLKYYSEGGGSDSFAGNDPVNSGIFNRYNLGGYFSLDYDVSDAFLISGTVRGENYSDFGNTFVYKLISRYKLSDKLTMRGSVSSGFRAPSLHQIYTEKSQYSFADGGGIEVVGLVNNVSPKARELGIPKLTPEKSTNLTVGFGGKLANNVSFTVDYYKIDVEDRVIYTNQIGSNQFFLNGFDTTTSGIDFVSGISNIGIGEGKLGLNLSGNYTIENKRTEEVPIINLEGTDYPVLDRSNLALMFTSRPKTKWILGANYDINKWGLALNNTYFGKTTFRQKFMSEGLRTEFTPKIVTYLAINYQASDKLSIALNINNLLNVLPEWAFKADNAAGQAIIDDTSIISIADGGSGLTQIENEANAITFNGRYSQMTYDGSHFSQLGTMFNLSLNYQF